MVVKIVKDWSKNDNLLRQTPGSTGIWRDMKFTEDDISLCDAIVFTNRIKNSMSVKCKKRWLLRMEPPTVAHKWMTRSDKFFDYVLSPGRRKFSNNYKLTHGAQPWHINMSYDKLKNLGPGQKPGFLSMITSNANHMEGHEFRLSVLKALQNQHEIEFDLFGYGFNAVEDKFDALYPYKYSIVIENSFYPHYWTEKIADALLSYTVPIYVGARDINDYFPKGSLIQSKPNIRSIMRILKNLRYDDWNDRLSDLKHARRLILDKYQLFPFLYEEISSKISENDSFKSFDFEVNKAPWEGSKISLYRKIEYFIRKRLNIKPFAL